MKKKTRININTNSNIYFQTFRSFFNKSNETQYNSFKTRLKKFLNSDNIILTSQGRVAAYNIFKILIKGEKKEFIISPYTLTEVINAIEYAGGVPKYIDIDPSTGLPNNNELDRAINENTAGIVITHLFCNDKSLEDFKKKYFGKIKIIEDTAINLGAKTNTNVSLGTIFDFGFYSFGIMKNLCTFHGGAIFARDKNDLNLINENMRNNENYPIFESIKLVLFTFMIDLIYNKHIFNFFSYYLLKIIKKNNLSFIEKIIYPGVYPKLNSKKPRHYNYNFCKYFSSAGNINLDLIENKQKNRSINAKYYEKYLNNRSKLIDTVNYKINSYLEFPILLKRNKNKELCDKLFNIGYEVRHTWYINSARVKRLNYNPKDFKTCELLHDYTLSLPTNSYFNEKDIKNICDVINKYE